MQLEARIVDGVFEAVVRDRGTWSPPADRGGGWGLHLVRGLMDSVDVANGSAGTVVTMRHSLQPGRSGG